MGESSTSEKLTPTMELLVDGSPADASIMESVILVRVHQHLELADAIEVRMSNDDLSWTDGDALKEGTKIAVKLGYQETSMVQVAAGEIVRRDCEFPVRGPAVVTLVAHDREHRLKRGRISRTFVDMKDSAIVSQIVGEAGLTADVEDSGVVHRYVFQNAQTNLSFIRERAMLIGYEVDVDAENGKVTFKSKHKPSESYSDSERGDLHWGENLLTFSPRMSTEEQVSSVMVKGWSMEQKKKIESVAKAPDVGYVLHGSGTKRGAKIADELYSKREVLYTHHPIHEQAECDAMAKAFLNRLSLRYTDGEASCQGDPALEAGKCVTVSGVGVRAGGRFYIYKALHHFEPGVGYSTHLTYVRATHRTHSGEPEEVVEQASERQEVEREQEHWVEIRVTSDTGESLEGVSYKVTLPNGEVKQGTLGADQTIKVEGIRDPGDCKIEVNQPDDLDAVE